MVGWHRAVIKPCACGKRLTEAGRETCFHCRVSSIGFRFRGGAIHGRDAFHYTQREFLKEHTGMEFGKELAKRTDIAKAD